MTQTMKQAADYEAKIQLIQMGIRQYNDTVFSASSFTEARNHIVTAIDGIATWCDCKWTAEGGWTRELKDGTCHKCAHAQATERYIAEEQRKIEEAKAASVIEQAVEVVKEADTKSIICGDCGDQITRENATLIQAKTGYYRCQPCRAEARIGQQAGDLEEIGIRFDRQMLVEEIYTELGLLIPTEAERRALDDKVEAHKDRYRAARPEYIRCAGGIVRRDAQERNHQRGEFSFLR